MEAERDCAILLAMLFCLSVSVGVIAQEEMPPRLVKKSIALAEEGARLSKEDVQKLERHLEAHPNDIEARIKLLGYYFYQHPTTPDISKARWRHIAWIIENAPDSEVGRTPYVTLNRVLDGRLYNDARNMWLKQVAAHKQNAAVHANAANFLQLFDPKLAEVLLKKARALEPNNPEWSQQLADLYSLQMISAAREKRKVLGAQWMKELEKTLQNTYDADEQWYITCELASATLEAGDLEKARTYAVEMLVKADEHKESWNYGNAIHKGNLILGIIELRSGNIEKAKHYLLEAGKTPGSPQLNSFGPNMRLAQELLEKGERDVVVEYLHLCAKFWKSGQDRLKRWEEEIKAGRIPDFGANLEY